MHRPEINLFQHPTTTVYIDDSTAFLYSITLGVDHQPFRSFSEPFAGLDYVERFARNYEFDSSKLNIQEAYKKIGQNFGYLTQQKLENSARFAEPSVVVVDYSMPQLNGLDLCSRIQNPYIKKVLLTGVADEKIAIKALNSQLIDFYISKSEASLSQELHRIISHLRDRYFQDIYGWTKDVRLRDHVPYLYNSDFADFFEDISEQLNIVEHYPLEEPWGFLLVSDEGKFFHLSITPSNKDQDLLVDDANKSALSIAPIKLPANSSSSELVCSIHPYNDFFNIGTTSSFSQYLQGPGLSVLTTNTMQESRRHDH